MPNFIVGGCVSANEWLRRDPDHQSYASEFAKDVARKQEDKDLGYKSEFVREMVGSLAQKDVQRQQVCDAKAEENKYVIKQEHGDELTYNNMRGYDDNLKVGRKYLIKPTSHIAKLSPSFKSSLD